MYAVAGPIAQRRARRICIAVSIASCEPASASRSPAQHLGGGRGNQVLPVTDDSKDSRTGDRVNIDLGERLAHRVALRLDRHRGKRFEPGQDPAHMVEGRPLMGAALRGEHLDRREDLRRGSRREPQIQHLAIVATRPVGGGPALCKAQPVAVSLTQQR